MPAFSVVVVQRHERVGDESRETVPVRDRVSRGFADGERLQRRLTPEPRLQLRKHRYGLRPPQLASELDVITGTLINRVELRDPAHREVRFGVVGLRSFELPIAIEALPARLVETDHGLL